MNGLKLVGIAPLLLLACSSTSPDSPDATGGNSAAGKAGSASAGSSSSNAGVSNGGMPPGAAGGAGGSVAGTPAGGGGAGKPSGGAAMGGGGSNVAGAATGGGSAGGASSGACTRDSLNAAADSYVAAIVAGDATKMMLAPSATYVENTKTVAIADGILKTALPVAFHRNLVDTEQCEAFSEIIITEGGHPYVIGAHLTLAGGSISAIDSLVTDDGDWLFDAAGYLKHSMAEDWAILPVDQQIPRDQLIAAANAYFDIFMDMSVKVPWGTPCDRLEGGSAYTGGKCDVGIPSGITFANKHFVVDIPMGTAIGIVRFGGANGLPDSHMFRVPGGKIRYVHTITVCTQPNCGM
jgi:hypothetical protein